MSAALAVAHLRRLYQSATWARLNATAATLAAAEAAEEAASAALIEAVDRADMAGTEHDPRTQGAW